MKVKLTLNRGSFYFMKNVHLVRNIPTEVDLSTLNNVELTGIKLNVKAGTILSDQPLDEVAPVIETQPVVEPVQVDETETVEVAEDTEETVEEVSEVEEPVEKVFTEDDFKELSNKVLKEKLAELGAEPVSNRKEDLVKQLVEVSNQ